MHEDTVCLLASQKTLEDNYKDLDMLPKVKKADMAGTMEAIKVCLRSCGSILRAPLVHIIRKTRVVQTYGDYPWYATLDDEIITRMLHLLLEKKKLLLENEASSVKEHTIEYKIHNKTVYNIFIRSSKICI